MRGRGTGPAKIRGAISRRAWTQDWREFFIGINPCDIHVVGIRKDAVRQIWFQNYTT